MSHPDTNEIIHEDFRWEGKCFYDEPTKDQDIVNWLRSENAYLRGKISAYEKYLRKIGIIADTEEEEMTEHQWVEQAKEEARLNLTGEDLEKCFKALEAWERNTQTE